tara:strand:+ start:336 stop:698 length:363 start_codon:yes stop_codon:yes gene_type:complete
MKVRDLTTYEARQISSEQISTENHGSLTVEVEVDTLEMATIRFGNSFTLRINEFNVDELRSILFDASRALAIQRSLRDNPSMHISNGQDEALDAIDDENDEGIDAWKDGRRCPEVQQEQL